jgi:5-methylcytosine-specific restriction protein A
MPFRPPIHQPHGGAVALRKEHDQWRGSAASRGYDAAWRALRKAKLAADPLCWWCCCEGILTPANTVDHIIPISERPALRLVWSNLRSGCKRCHDAHTAHQVAAGHRGMRGRPSRQSTGPAKGGLS